MKRVVLLLKLVFFGWQKMEKHLSWYKTCVTEHWCLNMWSQAVAGSLFCLKTITNGTVCFSSRWIWISKSTQHDRTHVVFPFAEQQCKKQSCNVFYTRYHTHCTIIYSTATTLGFVSCLQITEQSCSDVQKPLTVSVIVSLNARVFSLDGQRGLFSMCCMFTRSQDLLFKGYS